MNNSEKDLILMDQILYKGILGTDEWHSMDNDPLVIQDNATLKKVLESLNSTVTHEQMDNLQEAICDYVNSTASAAVIYGLRVADVMRSVSAAPDKLCGHIMGRIGKVAT